MLNCWSKTLLLWPKVKEPLFYCYKSDFWDEYYYMKQPVSATGWITTYQYSQNPFGQASSSVELFVNDSYRVISLKENGYRGASSMGEMEFTRYPSGDLYE